jgi:type I restriction enzyme M protein
VDALGDAYEYLIGQFAAGSGKKAGEFYTPQQISDMCSPPSSRWTARSPRRAVKPRLDSVMDFACGSGSLLLNVRRRMQRPGAHWQDLRPGKNITTYNLARMNMLLHGVKDTEFEIFHGDTLANEWDKLRELNPAKQPKFDAVVANPPFSCAGNLARHGDDVRFKNHGLAPKSAADFAFLLHGFHFLKDDGVMAIILPHGVLFRGGAEERIRTKLLKDGHIDTVIGLPSNLFYSTGIPVCILVLKKCKKPDDVLFINAAEHFVKGKRQNQLTDEHIAKIIKTYQHREEEARYARRVEMAEIEKNDFNLNISRYISTAVGEAEIDLDDTHQALLDIEKAIAAAKDTHNGFLKELGLTWSCS